MSNQKGPCRATQAYQALEKLHANGGSMSAYSWTRSMSWTGSFETFIARVVTPLQNSRLIFLYLSDYKITDLGLAYLGIDADAAPEPQPVVAGAPYSPGIRPLSAKHIVRLRSMREGSLDYREIPSRVGDHVIPHGTKA